jgi:hypothetical protein
MSTKFISYLRTPTVSASSTVVAFTEGQTIINLPSYTLSTPNYISTLALTISASPGNHQIIQLSSTGLDLSRVSVSKVNNQWTISSFDHAALNRFTQNMIATVSDDMGGAFFTITPSTEHASGASVNLIFDVVPVNDSINTVQTRNIAEDAYVYALGTNAPFLIPQIQDQLGPFSGKVYRVTFSPADAFSAGKYKIYVVNEEGVQYSDTVFFNGDQITINENMIAEGKAFHFDFNLDVSGPIQVKYTQEVISGTSGVPYIQEEGMLTFNIAPDVDNGATILADHGGNFFDRVKFTPVIITDSAGAWHSNNAVYQVKVIFSEYIGDVVSENIPELSWDSATRTAIITGPRWVVNNIANENFLIDTTFYNGNLSIPFTVEVHRKTNRGPDFSLLKTQNSTLYLGLAETTLNNVDRRFYNEDVVTAMSDQSKLINTEIEASLVNIQPITINNLDTPESIYIFPNDANSGIIDPIDFSGDKQYRLRMYIKHNNSTELSSLVLNNLQPRNISDTTSEFDSSLRNMGVESETGLFVSLWEIQGSRNYINNAIKSGSVRFIMSSFFAPPSMTVMPVVYELTDITINNTKCAVVNSTLTRI